MTNPLSSPAELADAERKVRDAAAAYYDSDALAMDDTTYDELVARIAATHDAYPEWDADHGLTTKVAAGVSAGGEVQHNSPMLSLDNVFSPDELTRWIVKLPAGTAVCVEPKLDGVAVSATYVAGTLSVVATRGDGVTGEDVTGVASRAAGLPEVLADGRDCEVRGEMVMTDDDFAAANEQRTASGKPAFVNPRNAAAGTLRKASSTAPLTFAAYDLVGADDHAGAMKELADLGFATSHLLAGTTPTTLTDPGGITAAVDALSQRRSSLSVGIDGAVIKANNAATRSALGDNGRAPRWAVAYKYPADTRLTKLVAIELSVGRTGVLTPVAVLDPVFVGGATVTYASLANPSEVVRKDLRVGDMVWVRRAGDVIPEVTGPQLESRPDDLAPWEPPTACPRCGAGVDTSSRRWRCAARTCGVAEAVAYAASRKALDIDGLGPEVVERLIDAGLVTDMADVFSLTVTQVAGLDRMAQRSATKLIDNIDAARSRPLDRVICALGVTGTGSRLSRRLAAAFGSLDALAAADVAALADVEGIGAVKAAVIAEELADLGDVLAKLAAAGVTTVAEATQTAASGPLVGKSVVVTGKVPGMSRDEAGAAVERLGGKAASSISAKTDLVVVGDGAGGAKLSKIAQLDIATMDAGEFARLATAVTTT